MSRRDTIVLATFINVGLLAILLLMAVSVDQENVLAQPHGSFQPSASKSLSESSFDVQVINYKSSSSNDEVDNLLKTYTQAEKPVPKKEEVIAELKESEPYYEITVKQGDALEKIARANATTVSAIKKVNQLQTEKLQIGQVLRVPATKEQQPIVLPLATAEDVGAYYILKSGDNPWKIAKQFDVRFEDLLKLNNLDEAQSKNLKVGDRIRVQ